MSRRHAREAAMQVLYGAEMAASTWNEVEAEIDERQDLSGHDTRYVKKVVRGVLENVGQIDGLLAEHLQNWTLDRIPRVDLAILRVGLFELGWCDEIPPGATINECVDIAKDFSTEKSSAFINGILASVKRKREGAAEKDEV